MSPIGLFYSVFKADPEMLWSGIIHATLVVVTAYFALILRRFPGGNSAV